MKNKIAMIGMGQAGGNVIVCGERRGFITAAINTSPEDLNADLMRIVNNKLLLGKNGGCGKERKIAKSNVKEFHEDIIAFVETKILRPNPLVEIVYIVFATSGGTGSGMSPIVIDLLNRHFKKDYPKLQFAGIGLTPSNDESPIALYNSRQCLEELYKLNIPILLPDNDNYKKLFALSSRKSLYNGVNEGVIDMIEELCIDRGSSDISNMDIKDKIKLLKTPGITVITNTDIMPSDMANETTIAKAIQDSWNHSVFVDIEYDKIVKRVGYIFEMPEKLTRLIDYNIINRDLGIPMEVFEGIYKPSTDNQSRVISIITGLSFPANKIKKIDEVLEQVKDIKSKEEKKDIFGKSNLKNMFGEDEVTESKEDESMDLGSFFDQY